MNTRAEAAFDPIWEDEIYGQGKHLNRYPFDCVVSFLYRHHPRGVPRNQIRVLEIGSGAGNNLWFAAREGFTVAGIDGSTSAVQAARKRFAEDGLEGDLRVGDFTALFFDDQSFDLVIDRGSLTCCGLSDAKRAVEEVRRVMKDGGKFFCNPYSYRHSSRASGRGGSDGLTTDITAGTLVGVGQLCFYEMNDLKRLFGTGWEILSLQHLEIVETIGSSTGVHAEWRIIAQKAGSVA
jgi:SAM-dependent methyltransferase